MQRDFQKFLLICFLLIWPGKLMQGVKWTAPKFNCVPGLTRDVTFFQLLDCTKAQMIWPELLSTSLTKALKSPQIVLCSSQETLFCLSACFKHRFISSFHQLSLRLWYPWSFTLEEASKIWISLSDISLWCPEFRRNDPERNAKLGVLKCMPDHIAGEIYLADYLLYRLNRRDWWPLVVLVTGRWIKSQKIRQSTLF